MKNWKEEVLERINNASDEEISHVICVPGIRKEQINKLIEALLHDKNQPENEEVQSVSPNLYVTSR